MKKSELPKPDRKTIERNRRIHMKDLRFKLASLIPPHHLNHSKQDQLDHAAAYINYLKERIEKLKKMKEQVRRSLGVNDNSNNGMDAMTRLNWPIVELRDLGSSIEVILISGLNKNFMLCEVLTIIEEEGAEVVSASTSTIADKVFHTIHAQVKFSRVGVETTRVCQRLQELIYRSCM